MAIAGWLLLSAGCRISYRDDVTEDVRFAKVSGRCIELVHPVLLVKWRDGEGVVQYPDISQYHLRPIGGLRMPATLEEYLAMEIRFTGEGKAFGPDGAERTEYDFELLSLLEPGLRITVEQVWETQSFDYKDFVFSVTLDGAREGYTVNAHALFVEEWLGYLRGYKKDPEVTLDPGYARFCGDEKEAS